MQQQYDVVFNHTVLEHVFETRTAVTNLCQLSRDIIITIVPFIQQTHASEGMSDFWRFTPQSLRKLMLEHNFTSLYESATRLSNSSVYIFQIASKHPEKWQGKIPCQKLPDCGLGNHLIYNFPGYDKLRRWTMPRA